MSVQVIIVAENASAQFGGEAVLPLHYFKRLKARRIAVKLIVHERVRHELALDLGADLKDVLFVNDTLAQRCLSWISFRLPRRLAAMTTGWCVSILTSLRQRTLVKGLLRSGFGDVIHEPTPVSPKQPSFMWGFNKPVVIGPMNGGMDFPPAFKATESVLTRAMVRLGRTAAGVANAVIPGKRQAALLLCANERTLRALPPGTSKRRALLVENGVDVELWSAPARGPTTLSHSIPTFVFVGRLVDWKAIDVLLEAMVVVLQHHSAKLIVIGDGPEAPRLRALTTRLRLDDHVEFLGFVPQRDCAVFVQSSRALVLPSLYECGGAVVLEAMCAARPVIATKWGGPTDYLTDACGLLVSPDSRQQMITGFVNAMTRLAVDPHLADQMGRAGQKRAREHFDWEKKIDVMVEHYRAVVERRTDRDLEASAA